MGKINGCLKCLFIFFNVLYAILGCVLIFLMAKATTFSNQLAGTGATSLGWGWLFAIAVFGIAGLGIYAGCSENGIALKIFAGFMAVGVIIMLICGILVVVGRNKVRKELDTTSAEVVKPYLKDQSLREMMGGLQIMGRCCGVVSVEDWDGNIPASCECQPQNRAASLPFGGYVPGCRSKPQGASGPDQIYEQTCGDFIFSWFNFVCKIMMGFFFGLAVTAVLGLLVSLLMNHQVRRHETRDASIAMKGY
ncbi:tetraspanin-33-like isoform X1 [Pungitius pungitius]|uniref:tetraspanin-33-like isoform X1 n=1 Tax=Pungitius pungitius TaxID=134920 RepID=UPI001888AEC7|nr:tetraspanin-33-like isoform X1 [Pungitius pungitius]